MTTVNISRQTAILNLIAYEEGVYLFKFTGDKEYVDSQGVTWTWVGVEDIAPVILGIRLGNVQLFTASNISEVKATPGSWYYDVSTLYIHWPFTSGDWAINRSISGFALAGDLNFADHFDPETLNYSNGLFYAPALERVSPFTFVIDPVDLGLSQSKEIRITIADSSVSIRNGIDLPITMGSIVAVDVDGQRTLTGITNGFESNERTIEIIASERRFFSDPKICRFVIDSSNYPNVADDVAGSVAPIVFGKVRRSRVVPVNTASVTKEASATIRFLVSQPGINSLNAQGSLYDSNGFLVAISASNLSECWVEYDKPANAELDLNRFTWSGTVGSTNGPQIIQDAFGKLAELPYVSSLWDISTWEVLKTVFNSKNIGLVARDNDSLLSAVIDPICNSLQIAMFTTGTGQISARARGDDAPVIKLEHEQMENISYAVDVRAFGPEIRVEYAPGEDGSLTAIADQNRTEILEVYGTTRQSEINPVQTVLSDQADALELATFLAELNKEPVKIRGFTTPYNTAILDLRPFDNIEADDETIEIHSVESDIYTQRVRITGRIK